MNTSNKNMKINIRIPKNGRKARNKRRTRKVRIPAPYREGNVVFGPGKTTLLFHKDEDFTSEMLDLYMTSILSDNSSEMAWAMAAFQYYKIVKVDIIVNPAPSSGKAYIGFYWNNQVFSDAMEFTQSDTTKICVFPSWKPKVFTYYPVNAVIMDIANGYNYKDWIPTTQTVLPGKVYYINDGTNASFRVQVLMKFRGSRTKTVNTFVNMFNKFSSSKLILNEAPKENSKEKEDKKEIDKEKGKIKEKEKEKEKEEKEHWYDDPSSDEEEIKVDKKCSKSKNKNKSK